MMPPQSDNGICCCCPVVRSLLLTTPFHFIWEQQASHLPAEEDHSSNLWLLRASSKSFLLLPWSAFHLFFAGWYLGGIAVIY